MRRAFLGVLIAILAGCGGGGGGGGGGTNIVTLSGTVLWIETGAAPDPVASVRTSSGSATTDPSDGFFQLAGPAPAGSLTVSFAPTGGSAIVRTFTYSSAGSSLDLGDLYIGPEEVDVKGRVVSAATGLPIGAAIVKLGGRSGTSTANGQFTVSKVAYSSTNLAVFLGLLGQATSSGFFPRSFSPQNGATAGVVDVGDIELTPEGTIDPPPPPYDLAGHVLPVSKGANAQIRVLDGSTTIRSLTADSNGAYETWLPTGTYILRATSGPDTVDKPVTISDTGTTKNVDITFP